MVLKQDLISRSDSWTLCTINVTGLLDIGHWSCALDNGQLVRTLFVDFSKAFDRVDHNILLNKMTYLGVSNCLIGWIFSCLQSRKQRVKLGNLYSGWADMVGGMSQGTWLGPLTFVIYVSDLIPSCIIHKFVNRNFTKVHICRQW